jgi:predicted transcriptional regulator
MTRKVNQNSIEAYLDQSRQEKAEEIKTIILQQLESNGAATNRQLARSTSYKYNQIQKRTSDLMAEGRVNIAGSIKENGRANSVYQFVTWVKSDVKRKSMLQLWRDKFKKEFPLFYEEWNDELNLKYKTQ